MPELLDALSLPFFQRALLAGSMLGAALSYFGVFIVQRGMAFMGDGLAHAAFGGVALGLLLGWEPLYIALPFTLLAALGISWLRERSRLGNDTTIGIIFALAVALGIVFLSQKSGYSVDAMTYLFGSILAVSRTDIWASAAVLLLALLSLPLWGRLAYASFDRESAQADGLPLRLHDGLLLALLALSIVVAVKIIGVILLSAFLVIPAASARLLAGRFSAMSLSAVLLGAACCIAGLLLSYLLDLPSGAAIILTQVAVFALCLILQGRNTSTLARPG
ncbi:metal ABC transporter permease [bacterium]|nr:metal ABC transporter permease [bacterium]